MAHDGNPERDWRIRGRDRETKPLLEGDHRPVSLQVLHLADRSIVFIQAPCNH